MNETIQSLHGHRSVCAYTDQMISEEDRRLILEAAMAAPTAGNQQMYTILDITDPAIRERLAVTCDNQPLIAKAKMLLIFLADFQRWYDALAEAGCAPRRPAAGDLMLAVTDAAIAAQNAVIAAQSLGIGSCYVGGIMESCGEHRRLLNLPQHAFPAVMLAFGYPARQSEASKSPRCRLEDIVCENRYQRKDGAALRTMLASRDPDTSYEEWGRRFCDCRYHSDFSGELGRSVGEYLRAFEDPGARLGWCSGEDRTEPIITAREQVVKEGEERIVLPETALVFFMGRGLDHLYEIAPDDWEQKPLKRFLNMGLPVYVHSSGKLCMLHGGYGAPQAADTVETLAELGVRRIIGVGMCGGYGENVHLGDLILPSRAYVEEGASWHYYEQIEYAQPDEALLSRAAECFSEGRCLPIVTTDAVYRQTYYKESLWRQKGCVGVDMEASALFSISRLKGIEAAMIMVVSDAHPLRPEEKGRWTWHMPRETREQLAERCMAFAMELS